MYQIINYSEVVFEDEQIEQVLPSYHNLSELQSLLGQYKDFSESAYGLPTGEDYNDDDSSLLDAIVELSKYYIDHQFKFFIEDKDYLVEMDSVSHSLTTPYVLLFIKNGKVQYQSAEVVWGEMQDL